MTPTRHHLNQRHSKESESPRDTATKTDSCPECGGTVRADPTTDEQTCQDCGLVIDGRVIDHGPEWRAFNSKEKEERSRVGSPTTPKMHDKGLSTNISWQDRDARGNPLSAGQRERMQRLRKWQTRTQTKDSKERTLKDALGEISRMSSALGVNDDTEETTCVLFRRCHSSDMLIGRSIEAMTSACLYIACLQCGDIRTPEDIYTVSQVEDDEINSADRYIRRELALEVETPNPKDHLGNILNKIDSMTHVNAIRDRAEDIIDAIIETNSHSGRSPSGLAGGALWLAARSHPDAENLTQEDVAEAAGVTASTIRDIPRIFRDNDYYAYPPAAACAD